MSKRYKSLVKCCVIPQRYLMAFMGMQSGFHAYTTRIALNMAITQMVELEEPANMTVSCPAEEDFYKSSAKSEDQIYDWSEWKQGIILGAFFWGYVITHIPAGIISDKYGVRHVLGIGILSSVIITLLTPIVITETNGNWIVLSFLRVVQGLGQGVLFPCSSTLIAKWTPPRELSFIGTVVFSGVMMGTVIGSLVNGHFMSYTKAWSSIFYLWGGIGLVWTACWYLLCYSTPNDSPFISEKELTYLQQQLGTPTQEKFQVPWKQFFKSPPVYAYVLTQVGCDYGFYTIVTDLPKYLNDVLKFDLKNNGLWNSIPFMFMTIISLVSGVISDQLIRHKKMTVTFARKFFTVIGCVIPAMLLMVASYAGCDRVLAAWMFVLATGFLGCTFCAIKVNAADLSPKFSGTLMALNNGVAAFTGIGAPFIAGAITTNHTMQEWQIVFWINFAILISAAAIFGIWASGKLQWWNDSPVKPTEGPTTST